MALEPKECIESEREWLRRRRSKQQNLDLDPDAISTDPDHRADVLGVALSGGGIRSAAFCLGALEYLEKPEVDLLSATEYVSTVSGGGFVGGAMAVRFLDEREERPARLQPFRLPRGLFSDSVIIDRMRRGAAWLAPNLNQEGGLFELVAVYVFGLILSLAATACLFAFLVSLGLVAVSLAGAGWASQPLKWVAFPGLVIPIVLWVVSFRIERSGPRFRLLRRVAQALLLLVAMKLLDRWLLPWAAPAVAGVGAPLLIGVVLWRPLQHLEGWIARKKRGTKCEAQDPAPSKVEEGRRRNREFLVDLIVASLVSAAIVAVPFVESRVPGAKELEVLEWWMPTAWGAGVAVLGGIASRLLKGTVGIKSSLIPLVVYPLLAGVLVPLILGYLSLVRTLEHWGDGRTAQEAILLCAAGGLLGLGLVWGARRIATDIWSVRHFFHDRLSHVFLFRHQPNRAERAPTMSALGAAGYVGPYHIVNASVNYTDHDEGPGGSRGAARFLFTPKHFGCKETGYATWKTLKGAESRTLAEALATSAAAVSPRMGLMTQRALFIVANILNLRLGDFLPNPKVTEPGLWARFKRRFLENLPEWTWFRTRYRSSDPLLYVTDGGHYDNSGILSLIERRCRYILAFDAEADPSHSCKALADAVRIARTDLDTCININVDDLVSAGGAGARSPCAVGRIYYPPARDGEPPQEGTLVYIKAMPNGSLPVDVHRYMANNPVFPHETTANQFFSEEQFEAYRELGFHITKQALRPARLRFDKGQLRKRNLRDRDLGEQDLRKEGLRTSENLSDLFALLRSVWLRSDDPPAEEVADLPNLELGDLDAFEDLRKLARLYWASPLWQPESMTWRQEVTELLEHDLATLQRAYQVADGFFARDFCAFCRVILGLKDNPRS